MWKKAILVFLILVAAFAGFVAMQPNDLHIERSTLIAAPPAEVFALVEDFHRWEDWSPWAKLDPQAKNSFDGPRVGKGAIFKWSGNDQVGEGSMTIVEHKPVELIGIRLEFSRPRQDASEVQFRFQPEGEQTRVTWVMDGEHCWISKAMCLVMSMDKMIGGEFEKGFAAMKLLVEKKT